MAQTMYASVGISVQAHLCVEENGTHHASVDHGLAKIVESTLHKDACGNA